MCSYYSNRIPECDTMNMYTCQKHTKLLGKSAIDKQVLYTVRNLEFRCMFHEKGCKDLLRFINFDDHIEKCPFKDINLNEICNSKLLNK